MNPDLLSTVNGIDAALFFGIVLVGVGWLYDRDRWRHRLFLANEAARRWSDRCIEAQGEVERLRSSVAAEIEARLDAEVEVRLEAAERAQSAEDRVEALAAAVWGRLHRQEPSHGPVQWSPDAVTMPSVEAVEVPEETTR